MTKTLADMTAEERADCVGMWADTPGNELAIIASVSEPDVSRVFFPQSRGDGAALLNLFIAPRFDLPRVWTPDGEPVDMSKEYGQCEMGGTPDGSPAIIVYVDDGRTEYASEDTPHGEVYRWVGEWEQDND